MSACVEATTLGPQSPHTFTTPAPLAETAGRIASAGPTWLTDGDTQRAVTGGYAAWVTPHEMAGFGWRYGYTSHGVDGLQAVRLSGVAKLLLGEDHPAAPR